MCIRDRAFTLMQKGKQDSFNMKYCRAYVSNSKRKERGSEGKSTTFKYSIVSHGGVKLGVCRNTFLYVLKKQSRLIGVHRIDSTIFQKKL